MVNFPGPRAAFNAVFRRRSCSFDQALMLSMPDVLAMIRGRSICIALQLKV